MLKRIIMESTLEWVINGVEEQGKWEVMTRKEFLDRVVEAHSKNLISDKCAFNLTQKAMTINTRENLL